MFVILAPELIPEIVTVLLPGPADFVSARSRVQASRAQARRRWFPSLLPAVPQPVQDHVILLALPDWCHDIYVVCDCLRVNGTVFCSYVRASMDRASLLAAAGFSSNVDYEVYVHGLVGPLGHTEFVEVASGYCVSFLPRAGGVLVVSDVDDRLADPSGWNLQLRLPVLPGTWIHLLTDNGSDRLLVPADGRRFLRQHIAAALGLAAADFSFCSLPGLRFVTRLMLESLLTMCTWSPLSVPSQMSRTILVTSFSWLT